VLSLTSQGAGISVDGAGRCTPPLPRKDGSIFLPGLLPAEAIGAHPLAPEPHRGGGEWVEELCYPCLLQGQV